MKAIVCGSYGAPDVLQIQEVQQPVPKEGEVRIRVSAASVGPSDCSFRKGDPFLIRLLYGLKRPKYSILGTELAGVIESVGSGVRSFQAGDRVMGISPKTFGAYAEFVCLPEQSPLVLQSSGMTHEEAAALCDGAPTALTFLRDEAKLKPGQRLLINGASGAVGAYAVQLGNYYGAEVAAVCSGKNADWVRALGAHHLIDYTREDFTRSGKTYDVIFDAVGKSSYSSCGRALTPQGMYLTTVPSAGIALHVVLTRIGRGRKAVFATAGLRQSQANLRFLLDLYESGRLKPVIDRSYPLEQAAEAHRYVETERKKGNVLLVVE